MFSPIVNRKHLATANQCIFAPIFSGFTDNMKIYKDVKTGDELFSDVNGLKDVANGWVYEVVCLVFPVSSTAIFSRSQRNM